MSKTIIFLTFFIFSCDFKPQSEGGIDDILIVASEQDRPLIEPYFEEIFNIKINTPQEERIFNLIWIKPWDIKKFKKYYNIILVSLAFPIDSTADVLTKKNLIASSTNEKIFIREDLYSKNQTFMSINGHDIIDFKSVIDINFEWIYGVFMEKYNNHMIDYIYSKGLNNELMNYINDEYNVSFDIQKDYIMLNKDQKNNFFWIGRGYPYRWITYYKVELVDEYSFWDTFILNTKTYMPQIEISEYYRSKEEKINMDHINIYRGIYDHEISQSGGPFFVYEFKNIKKNEIYLLSGYVNYPGNRKINLLNGIEVLFESFKF
ncbi:MAG: hypothetical protein CMG07_02885 [Candidatus Marinimicrobia bacterium]|nr:hypothetical protein [Candidatus Neomarinimicrobiota bacterium]